LAGLPLAGFPIASRHGPTIPAVAAVSRSPRPRSSRQGWPVRRRERPLIRRDGLTHARLPCALCPPWSSEVLLTQLPKGSSAPSLPWTKPRSGLGGTLAKVATALLKYSRNQERSPDRPLSHLPDGAGYVTHHQRSYPWEPVDLHAGRWLARRYSPPTSDTAITGPTPGAW
jgi:hypothetical protein